MNFPTTKTRTQAINAARADLSRAELNLRRAAAWLTEAGNESAARKAGDLACDVAKLRKAPAAEEVSHA